MYFIEYLTLRSWFGKVLPRLLRRREAVRVCYAIDASTLALAAAKVTARLAGVSVEKLAFRLVDVRDESGLLIRLRVAYSDLAEVQADAMKDEIFREFVEQGKFQGRLPAYLAKSIATISLSDRGTLWRALLLVQICVWKLRHEKKGSRPVLFLEVRPWIAAVVRYASSYGVEIAQVTVFLSPSVWLRRLLGCRGLALGRWVRDRLYCFFYGVAERLMRAGESSVSTPRFDRSVISESGRGGSRLAVEYYGHLNLDRPELFSDLFFWQRSSLPGSDILVVFPYPQDPVDGQKLAALEKHRMVVVAIHPKATTLPSVPVFIHRPHLRSRMKMFWRPKSSWRGSEWEWLKEQVEGYYATSEYWADFFSAFGVKVFLTWHRYDARHYAIADALQQLGGVSAIYQRALEVASSPEFAVNADIMFGYSPRDAEIDRGCGAVVPYHVAVGYFGDHRFPLLQDAARRVRDSLEEHGAERVLAFFDENSADDSRWHTGHEFQRANYEFLLEKVLRDPRLGLVLKPKVPRTLRRRLGPVAGLLKRAEETGRCYVFEGGALHGSYPPAVGALAADVAIHGHLCAATAGFEAALTGVPTLLLDREGWPLSPMYRLGIERVVFTNWEDLWSAVMSHWSRPGGIPSFGDWSPMLDELDPFRDGRAAERMGTYIQWLIEGFKAGLDRETVMADAAERYCKSWGWDKVNKVNVDSSAGVQVSQDCEDTRDMMPHCKRNEPLRHL